MRTGWRHCEGDVRSWALLLSAAFCTVFLPPATAVAKSYTSMFFTAHETESDNLKPFPKWGTMWDRFDEEKKLSDQPCGTVKYYPCKVKEWRSVLDSLHGKPLKEQVEQVNSYINQFPYIIDQVNWGVPDYWETPHEFLEVYGDCEDYAISKFISLRALGVPNEKMRIIIVQDMNLGGIIHAILGVYEGDDIWILDNQLKQVANASSIYHYRLIYSINETNWWAYRY